MSRKLVVLFSAILVIFTLLYIRVSSISFDSTLSDTAKTQITKVVPITKTRGQIYDCNLTPLVDNEQELVLFPQQEKPFSIPKRYSSYQPAQHLIGYIDKATGDGVCGVERQYNELLSSVGETTELSYTIDGKMRPLGGVSPSPSYAKPITSGVVLTIDKGLQELVEKVGFEHIQKGAIVVTEIKTGRLKAAASFPLYNANALSQAMQNDNSPLINRVYTAYSVGSVFKLVTAATALEAGISPTYTCTGKIEQNGVTFGCHNKNGHGEIDMSEAIAVSCNPYFINLSTLIDKQAFLNMASDLSFGKPYYSGNLPTASELKNIGDISNLSFGQGSLTATPLQVAELVGAVANNGKCIRTSTIMGTTADGKTIDEAEPYYPTVSMSEKTADTIAQMMVKAVMDTPNQNAKPTKMSAGGKTATAQTGQFVDGEEILNAWFAGFFPAKNPVYCITVVVEEAKSGNQSASPVFKELVDQITAPKKAK